MIGHMLIRTLANSLLLPPGLNIVLFIVGLLLFCRWHTILGIGFITISAALLYCFSTAFFAAQLINPLQPYKPLNLEQIQAKHEKAIVVLTGGAQYAPEYLDHQPSHHSLARELYAADLHKTTHLPLIIVGGKGHHGVVPESTVIQQHLARYFDISTTWVEINSRDTRENVLYAKQILDQHHLKSFYLVTSAWHMPRAFALFKQMGFSPTPAPTDYFSISRRFVSLTYWLPSARMLLISKIALHEYLARMWYHWCN